MLRCTDLPLLHQDKSPPVLSILQGIDINTTRTASGTDLSNLRTDHDANANGIVDAGEASVSGAGIPLSADTRTFYSITGQTGLTTGTAYNYSIKLRTLMPLSVRQQNFSTGIANAADVSAGVTVSGTAPGNQQSYIVAARYVLDWKWNMADNNNPKLRSSCSGRPLQSIMAYERDRQSGKAAQVR